jgi:hypothetical protein
MRHVVVVLAISILAAGCKRQKEEPPKTDERAKLITVDEHRVADAIVARRSIPSSIDKSDLRIAVANIVHVRAIYPAGGAANDVMPRLGSRWGHEGDDAGFGVRLSTAELPGGGGCSTIALVFDHRIARSQTRCGVFAFWADVRDLLLEAAGPGAVLDERAVVFSFRDAELEPRARAAVAAELGAQVESAVPANLAAAYDDLASPFTPLVFGSARCGEGAETPHGRDSIEALVRANRFDLIGNVARGLNPVARVYAAQAMLARTEPPSAADAVTIAKVRALPVHIPSRSGCSRVDGTADALLSRR